MKTFSTFTSMYLVLTFVSIVKSQPSAGPSLTPSKEPIVVSEMPAFFPSQQPLEVGATNAPSVEPSTEPINATPIPPAPSSPIVAPSPTPPIAAPVAATPVATTPIAATPVATTPVAATPPTNSSNANDLCERNEACDALGLTGQCCPTIDNQFLACCGGDVEQTCQANSKCAALGLLGACCPTAGNRRPKLNDIYLDCCETVPDECGGNSTSSNDTDTTSPPACERLTALEYKLALEAPENTSGSVDSGTSFIMTTIALVTTMVSITLIG
jgi:hypothetical protein